MLTLEGEGVEEGALLEEEGVQDGASEGVGVEAGGPSVHTNWYVSLGHALPAASIAVQWLSGIL